MSRSRKSIWNFASSLGFTAVTLAVGIFSTPLLLGWLGTERFGAARVLTDWGGYLLLLERGLSGALWARLAAALGQGDNAQTALLITAGRREYVRVMVLCLAVGAALFVVMPRLTRASGISVGEIRAAWLCLLAVLLLLPLAVYRLLAEANQESYLVTLLNTAQALLTTLLLLAAARAGWGLPGQTAAVTLAQIPFVAALAWRARRRWPQAAESDLAAARQSLRELNGPAFAYTTSLKVGVLSDNVVVATFLGGGAVTAFSLTQRLAQLAQTQLLALGNATWASLAELHAEGQKERFYERVLELTGLVSGLSLAVLLPVAAYNRHFIALWVGPENFGGAALSLLVCVNAWLGAVFYLWGWALQGTGNLGAWTRGAVAFGAVNLAVSIVATLFVGLPGPLWGTLAGYLLITAWALPRALQGVFGWRVGGLWRSALKPLLWGLPLGAGLWWRAISYNPAGWLGLALETAAAGGLGAGLWLLFTGRAQRHLLLERFRKSF
jgi:O-antigen/teichoic acid export membrane protein